MTRCVLLLLYGGLLHHQNIKCPVGKRACAWVHPHFTFTADCRLNWATFPRFLAPENVLVRPSRILSHSPLPVAPKRGHWSLSLFLSPVAPLFRPAKKFTPFLISQILFATYIFLGKFVLCFQIAKTWFFRQSLSGKQLFFSLESVECWIYHLRSTLVKIRTNVNLFLLHVLCTFSAQVFNKGSMRILKRSLGLYQYKDNKNTINIKIGDLRSLTEISSFGCSLVALRNNLTDTARVLLMRGIFAKTNSVFLSRIAIRPLRWRRLTIKILYKI